jgi:hypothetical protein
MRTTVLVAVLLVTGGARAGEGSSTLPWPTGLTYEAAATERVARGPGAACPEGDGLWLFDAPTHSLARVDAEGSVKERVPAPGFVQAVTVRADGSLAWVDLARRTVVQAARDGGWRRELALPPGLDAVRRVVEIDGRLWLHTELQESFAVPDAARPSLRAWFATRREGWVLAPQRPAVQVLASAGRVVLRTFTEPTGPTTGAPSVAQIPLPLAPDALAAEVIGPAPGDGWWLRVTRGPREHARNELTAVDARGRVLAAFALPSHGTLSWADTLFVSTTGAVIGLTPTDTGVVRQGWRLP